MKRGFYIFLIGVLVGMALGIWFARYVEADSCVDRGGIWNGDTAICDPAPVEGV